MALAVVMPERKFSYDELDKISKKLSSKWTWPTAAMLWMLEQNLKIGLIEEFDYRAFVDEGEKYILSRFGEEVGRAQIENSDIEVEREIAKRFVSLAPIETRIPTIKDIKKMIDDGAIVIVNLNAAMLHGVKGYSGHFVVVCDVGENIVLHDPGLPPFPNFQVSLDIFERAWGYPKARDKNLLYVKKAAIS